MYVTAYLPERWTPKPFGVLLKSGLLALGFGDLGV